MHISRCRWSSPACLESLFSLKERYPDQRQLFFQRLGIKNADIADVVEELRGLNGVTTKIETIKQLLLFLNGLLVEARYDENTLKELRTADMKVLPVQNVRTELRSCHDEDWFIADRKRLRDCFQGRIHIFDFDHADLGGLSCVLQKLKVQQRALSKCVFEETEAIGASTYNEVCTRQLQSKAVFISQYAM